MGEQIFWGLVIVASNSMGYSTTLTGTKHPVAIPTPYVGFVFAEDNGNGRPFSLIRLTNGLNDAGEWIVVANTKVLAARPHLPGEAVEWKDFHRDGYKVSWLMIGAKEGGFVTVETKLGLMKFNLLHGETMQVGISLGGGAKVTSPNTSFVAVAMRQDRNGVFTVDHGDERTRPARR